MARDLLAAYTKEEAEQHTIKERTFTVVYGPNFVDLVFINFVAGTIAEAEKWGEAVFKCANNLLRISSAPLEFLEVL